MVYLIKWPAKLSSTQRLYKASKKSRMIKQQRAPRFQDLSPKQVSVIYLMFNTKGEVITTKSHPCARNQDVIDITGTFNSFYWKRPLPLIRNLLSRRCPLTSILEPCCFVISPDISDSFQPNTADDQCERESGDGAPRAVNISFPSPLSDQPSLCSPKKFWSGEVFLEKTTKASVLPAPARATESAPPAGPTDVVKDQADNCVHYKRNKKGSYSSTPQNRGVTQKGEDGERDEILLPAVATSKEASLRATDVLCTTAAAKTGPAQNLFPKMAPHPHASYRSSIISRAPPHSKVRGHSNKGTVQKRRLGKLHLQEDPVTTAHANLPASTWKDILIGLHTGEGGGSLESITLQRGGDRPIPAPPKGHVPKNGTSNGLAGLTRKPGQRVSLVPLPKTSSQ